MTHSCFTAVRRRALTIVELMVSVAIMGLLIAILLPAVQAAREASRRSQCASHLHQVGVALHSYYTRHNVFPPGYLSDIDEERDDLGPGWSWGAMLLDDLELGNLKPGLNFGLPIEHASNRAALLENVSIYNCPSDGEFRPRVNIPQYAESEAPNELAGSNYVGSVGTVRQTCKVCRDKFDGVFGRNSKTRIEHIVDGTGRTFAVGERNHRVSSPVWGGVIAKSMIVDNLIKGKVAAGPAYVLGSTFLHGDQEELEERSRETVAEVFASEHLGVMNFLYCDGSVRMINVSIDENVYLALSTTNDQPPGEGTIHRPPVFTTP
jgi:prepilin-type processing-associated H-X9-DG protein